MLDDETRFKLLKRLHENPGASQRDLARDLGVSVGKINFCMQALVERGLVKARNFKNNPNKRAYAYVVTPKGAEEKARVAVRFLKAKLAEYEALQQEIALLRKEVASLETSNMCAKDLNIQYDGSEA